MSSEMWEFRLTTLVYNLFPALAPLDSRTAALCLRLKSWLPSAIPSVYYTVST